MSKLEISYNTDREDIRFPEYGRGIQEMLEHACNIEPRPKRQKTVEAIINLMQLLNPAGKSNIEDYREKLWNQAFAIAHYKLDVTPPSGITIRPEDDKPKLTKVPYPPTAKRFRHYGNNVQTLIAKAIDMPDGSKREGFVEVIASYMKLAYKTWNKEHYVSDDVIKDDLEALSDGRLELHEGHSSLDILAYSVSKRDKELQRSQDQQKRNRNRGGGGKNRKRGGGSSGGGGNSGGGNYGYRKRKK